MEQLTVNKDYDLSKKETLVILYILHKPDYVTKIAKKFKNFLKSRDKKDKRGFSTITNESKLSALLKKMREKGIVSDDGQTHITNRKFYRLNPRWFSIQLNRMTGLKSYFDGKSAELIIEFLRKASIDKTKEHSWLSRIASYEEHGFKVILSHLILCLSALNEFIKFKYSIRDGSITLRKSKSLENRLKKRFGYKPLHSKFRPTSVIFLGYDNVEKPLQNFVKNAIKNQIPVTRQQTMHFNSGKIKILYFSVIDDFIKHLNYLLNTITKWNLTRQVSRAKIQ